MSRRDDLIPMFDPPVDPDLCPSRCLEDKRGQTAQGLPASDGFQSKFSQFLSKSKGRNGMRNPENLVTSIDTYCTHHPNRPNKWRLVVPIIRDRSVTRHTHTPKCHWVYHHDGLKQGRVCLQLVSPITSCLIIMFPLEITILGENPIVDKLVILL